MDRRQIVEISLELQRLAFNLADELDTLNFHSMGEAVSDMRRGVYRTGAEMSEKIRALLKHSAEISGLYPDEISEPALDELSEMDSRLESLRKCTGEPKNYRDFIEALPGLMRLCEKWGDTPPLGEIT